MFLLNQWRRQQISWLTLGVSLSLLVGVGGSMWWLDVATEPQTTVALAAPRTISLTFVPFGSATFTEPVKIASAGDNRLFVIEQAGKIFVLQADGTKVTTPLIQQKLQQKHRGTPLPLKA